MMGSSFNRLLHGRRRRGKGGDRAMRDTVLAGCVTVLFFSIQSPEIVDRWLWLPFMLALCFRDPGPTGQPGLQEHHPHLRTGAGAGSRVRPRPHGTAPASARSPHETAEPLPVLRRVSGTVPSAARTRRPS